MAQTNKRDTYKNSILKCVKKINSFDHETTITDLNTYSENLESNWSAFENVHFAILEVTGPQEIEFQKIEYDAVETSVMDGRCKLNELLAKFALKSGEGSSEESSEESTVVSSKSHSQHASTKHVSSRRIKDTVYKKKSLRLPPMQLSEFDGSYAQWPSFSNLFVSLIHKNADLSNVQKLYYLKKALHGEAAELISDMQLTDENYESAWETVKLRYENKYPLVLSLLDKIFQLPQMTKNDSNSARKLLDSTTQAILSLKNLNRPTEHWDDILIYITITKLDTVSKEKWNEKTANVKDVPKWSEMQEFLQSRYRSYDASITPSMISSTPKPKLVNRSCSPPMKAFHVSSAISSSSKVTRKCPACSSERKDHRLRLCTKFKSQTPQQRRGCVETNHLCFNCFSGNHTASSCTSTYSCQKCQLKHHTLLHIEKQNEPQIQTPTANLVVAVTQKSQHLYKHVVLATALIQVKSRNGVFHRLRALLDPGSQASFITENATKILNLCRRNTNAMFESVGNHEIHQSKGVLNIEFRSCRSSSVTLPTYPVEVFILSTITSLLPSQKIERQNWNHLANLPLADPTFFEPGQIDLLLGGDVYPDIIREGIRKCEFNSLIAQNSELDWIVMGNVALTTPPISVRSINFCQVECKHMQQFWEVEEMGLQKPLSEEDKYCEEHFIKNYRRTVEGRYVIRHQFKKSFGESLSLGQSRNLALFSQYRLERRFEKNPKLRQDYVKVLDELLSLKYLEQIPDAEVGIAPEKSFYLPHHPVIREDSSTTKLRIVFNASIKSSNGVSLNDTMIAGPSLQNNLVDILIRARKYPIAFAADVVKMYKQILVESADCDYQRIVWRRNPTDPIKDYRLLVLTDGFNSAPYLAIRTVHQLASDECSNFPLASEIAKRDMYMDDVFSGGYTVEDALTKQRQLIGLFEAGGFCLRKWSSNAPELLQSVPKEDLEITLNFGKSETVKTLGIYWNPAKDQFGFKVKLSKRKSTVTKRELLSEASRLFDPLGWLAPSIIIPKILFQRLWIHKIDWDDDIPPEILEEWIEFRESLSDIEDIKIDRWIGNSLSNKLTEIHGFSDASEKAYCGVVYVRNEDKNGFVTVRMIASKTKVAPVNSITLPNLELCGALLLARLIAKIQLAIQYPSNVKIVAWSDSMLVLWWLQSLPIRWKTFVANRTSEILQVVPSNQWRFISSKENPADCGTRGVFPKDLKSLPLWWNGPKWLEKSPGMWPNQPITEPIGVDTQERKTSNVVATMVSIIPGSLDVLKRFSSLRRLIRFTARAKRMAINIKLPSNQRRTSYFTVAELQNALQFWIKAVQARYFKDEIERLSSNQCLLLKSSILALNPILDANGILRVGGRLKHAKISLHQKHPIILPLIDQLSYLIVSDAHDKTYHGHIQLMLNTIRQRFWILGVRKLVKKCVYNCKICFRFTAKAKKQLMANLPKQRVNPSRPFSHTGVDYAGPIQMKKATGKCRTFIKGYVAIFVCMATRAIHLEAVSDLTTDAFLAAFRRFTGRKGYVDHVYSDNGSNFKGATKEIATLLKLSIEEAEIHFAAALADDNVQWHFNPPGAPHFNGMAEAGVKSMKYHVRRVLGNSNFTFEELGTVLCQVEAALNSRPICALTDDIDDLDALTPGHFIMGSAPISLPEPSLLKINENRLARWQRVQQSFQDIWKRWSEEYLHTLQQRKKWKLPEENITVGDLVLIVDENLPPMKWLMGRVTTVYPDKEGKVRSVEVKCQKSVLKRPIVKVCPLPMSSYGEEVIDDKNGETNEANVSGDH